MNTELSKALDEPCCYPTQLIVLKYFRTPPKITRLSSVLPLTQLSKQNSNKQNYRKNSLGALTFKSEIAA